MEHLLKWLEEHQLPCFYKRFFGIECPGCGMQRSFIALLKGELLESFYLFPALIPLLFMLVVLVLHLIFKFSFGPVLLKWLFILTALIITISFFYKSYYLLDVSCSKHL